MTNLESLRRSLGLSQTKAAKELDISRFWYWLIEKNGVQPSDEIAGRLEKYFNQPIKFLLEAKDLERRSQ